MSQLHSIVWVDHHKAVVWNFTDDEQSKSLVKTRDQDGRTHLRSSPHGGHKPPVDHEFFEAVLKPLAGVHEILVIGPAQTKHELVAFARTKHPDIAKSIVAVESSDHPTDAELLAYARKHFKVIDRMI